MHDMLMERWHNSVPSLFYQCPAELGKQRNKYIYRQRNNFNNFHQNCEGVVYKSCFLLFLIMNIAFEEKKSYMAI